MKLVKCAYCGIFVNEEDKGFLHLGLRKAEFLELDICVPCYKKLSQKLKEGDLLR